MCRVPLLLSSACEDTAQEQWHTRRPGTSPTHARRAAAAAVAALAKAIELDPGYRDKAKSDPGYDPIRDDAGFRKLTCGE